VEMYSAEKGGEGMQLGLFLESEKPVRKVFLKDFMIDKYEVTNGEYSKFCKATKHQFPAVWVRGEIPEGRENFPVNNITWFDASEYCSWLKKRLPKEEEWEKAARGSVGRRYPWGDEFDIKKANVNLGDTLAVGSMPEDRSEYGVYDMAGNVMEWTVSWYRAYPGSTLESEEFGVVNRVLKGWSGTDAGHFGNPEIFSRSSSRHFYLPFGYGDDIGFRCVSTVIDNPGQN
ncbi:MAG: formylglycine-generating enzyme family protein, partial [Nitrospinota bacterium]